MTDEIVLGIAQYIHLLYCREFLDVRRRWAEATEDARSKWLNIAQRTIPRIDELRQTAGQPSKNPNDSPDLPATPEMPGRTVTAAVLERSLGVSRRTVCRYVADGMPHARTPG